MYLSPTMESSVDQTINESSADPNPINQFRRWFDQARAAKIPLAEAITLATATVDGKPSARMVLLKQVDDEGFVFYTNYRSRKSRELDANPFAALVFYWQKLDYQVRVEGVVARVTAAESDEYFATRPRESQLGAHASPQSDVVSDRAFLEERYAELEEMYSGADVPRPEHWGGYRLKPDRIEFWKSRVGRLHDRLLYERQPDGSWLRTRLAP
ncbi:MAG TPA: pyridoxamine 5'-phosphate oxidase [Pyrinomonadaceae bacterium]|nr:pyridoxamine 5'-phosphate oxidase [Pyrinomonadaceae bacterium]